MSKKKANLVRYIVEDGMSIRDAANKAEISYSWARNMLNRLVEQDVIERSVYREGENYDTFMEDNQ
ncbi:MAG: hypothetical protein [Caudoviricetes sp.]|nr:MAG: hypothetical protein [Caudoviricetes sp.]